MNQLMSRRYLFFAISLLIIIPGLISLGVWGLKFSIDFVGGSLLEARFASGKAPQPAQVVEVYHELGIPDAQVSSSGSDLLIIRSTQVDTATLPKILEALSTKFNDTVTTNRFDNVGPTLAKEVTTRGIMVVAIASILLAIYITLVFRGVPNAFRYGACTVAALIHDVLVMLSVAAITGHFLGWEVDALFLTALLTVIAFSAQDTIVVFDRIRENAGILRKVSFENLVNNSVVQTLTRSLNTQIMAVDFILLALVLFGGVTLQKFALFLLVGMFSGSYSSGFSAAPLLIVWENHEWKNWFRPHRPPTEMVQP